MPDAILDPTGLELHDTGTTNLNGIINGNWEILNEYLKTLTGQNGLTTITYAATITIPIKTSKPLVQCSLTGDVIVAVSEKLAGLSRILTLIGDGTDRAITWPAGAVWAGEALAVLEAGTTRLIFIEARGTDNADLVLSQMGGGGGGATPAWAPADEGLACNVTVADGDSALAAWAGFDAPPVGRVDTIVSQTRHATVGDGAKDKDCYFSNDGTGTIALSHEDVPTATKLHWMGSIAGYELSAADTVTFRYSI